MQNRFYFFFKNITALQYSNVFTPIYEDIIEIITFHNQFHSEVAMQMRTFFWIWGFGSHQKNREDSDVFAGLILLFQRERS